MSERLEDIAKAMMAEGKGILAADESGGTIKKRFETIGVESTEESRRAYREMLFTAEEAMKNHISGVILYEETLYQSTKDGRRFVDVIKAAGAVPGIKVDKGAKPLALFPGEKVTEGLDGLRERLKAYYDQGARFAKWRAVIDIGAGLPTETAIHCNAHALGRYAALCQEAGIVPIVEPEVLMDGPNATHDIDRCYAVSAAALKRLFQELAAMRVSLAGTVLKPNMVIAGKDCPKQAPPEEVAAKTVKCLKENVPAEVAGIAFLSGGQSDEVATHHLSLINRGGEIPWPLTFSYGRALQAAAIKTWHGRPENVGAAQKAFLHRAHMNALAAKGRYSPEDERDAA